ncbi:MAG: protein-disulfide reductase DsbD family protein, partial [Planctomycetota bacterium]
MWKEAALTFCLSLVLVLGPAGRAEDAVGSTGSAGVVIAQYGKESSSARIVPARMDGRPGIAVVFEGTDDLHYYAKKETAPAGYKLEIAAASDDFEFGEAVFPRWSIFRDPLGESVEVYAGRFVVFVPIKAPTEVTVVDKGDVEVKISGIACTSQTCLSPFEKALQAAVDWSRRDSWEAISLPKAAGAAPAVQGPSYSVWFALGLAFVAGLALNIMPCVWPVLPIIVMRIVEQARHSRAGSVAMGLVFCLGIVLFFACLAGVNIILQLFYGTVLQWGDQFRNPAFVAGMALLLIVLALFMFGVFTITVPSSIASRSGPGRGYAGALGMGFLAAILSTPCSFGILAAAFAWAQGQHLALGTFAILVIGVGMALPYAILTSVPGLLKRLPRAGRWMELFKQAIGFVLLVIAVKLIAALPEVRRTGVMYFAVILGFCVWMWGGWVGYNTPAVRKWLIRIIAVA